MVIQAAAETDLPDIRRLLDSEHLPLAGVDEHVSTMVVAKEGDEITGAAGVEVYPDGALLRSVVVGSHVRGQGLGHRLTEAALNVARVRGARSVFLLTTTADNFFPKMGFVRISRDEVPASVQTSVEFQSACPASAIVMRKRLAEPPP